MSSKHTDRTDYDGADVEWTCTRKKYYRDEKFAKTVAGRMRADGKNVVHYACTRCGGYHIGRAPGS